MTLLLSQQWLRGITPPSAITLTVDIPVTRATAATVAAATTTTKMTIDTPKTMVPTTTLATISHHVAAVPSVPSSLQAHMLKWKVTFRSMTNSSKLTGSKRCHNHKHAHA